MKKLSFLLAVVLLFGCSPPTPTSTPTPASTPVATTPAATSEPPTADEVLDRIASTLKSEDAEGYSERGMMYLMAAEEMKVPGAYERAVEDFTRSIELDPKLPGNYNNRGMAYIRMGQLELAEKDFDQFLALKPDARGYASRAQVRKARGQMEKALEDYDAAIELEANPVILFNRGNTYLQLERFEEAARDFQQVADTTDNDGLRQAALGNLAAAKEGRKE